MTSRRILAAVFLLCAIAAPAQAQKTKAVLNAEIGTSFPDNSVGAITPLILRNVTDDIVNSIMPTAPVVSGNSPSFDGTTGLLKDSGAVPRVKLPTGVTDFYSNSSATGCNGGVPCLETNDGLTPGTAKKTWLGMAYGVLNGYDFTCTVAAQSTAKVHLLANEVNAGASLHYGPHDYPGACSGSSVTLDGGGFTYEYDSSSSAAIAPFFTVPFQLQNVTVANTLGPCIAAFEKASIRFGAGMVFGNCGVGLQTNAGSVAVFLNNFTISTNTTQTAFIQATEGSVISFSSGITGTCTGAPTWTWTFVVQIGSKVNLNSMSWSGCGSVTGQAYLATDGASIVNGAASIPSNVPGVTNSGATADGAALAITAGGTGGATASAARTALGLGALSTVTPGTGVASALANGTNAAGGVIAPVNVLVSPSAPSITSGFGGGAPTISAPNGTAGFRVTIGTASGSTGVLAMPTATTGWNCFANDQTTHNAANASVAQTASSASSVTLTSFSDIMGAATWVAADVIAVSCFAF